MASTINADNGVVSGSAGLKSSADSTGVLALQTNGTTAASISTSQVVTLTNALPVGSGGTGLATTNAYGLIAAGTTSTGNFQQVSGTGTSGQVLTSNGAGALPSWQTSSGGGAGNSIFLQTNFGGF
jgi:hypothetical protein